MDFPTALKMIKSGSRMTRTSWEGANPFVFLVPGSKFTVNRPPLLGIYPEGTPITYRPHIDLKASDGSVGVWAPSCDDLLADDWEIIRSP